MTLDEIKQWAAEHHFPFLVLGDKIQRHGEERWSETLAGNDEERIEQIVKRIEEWNERARRVGR